MTVTMKDVAKKANLAVGTVSNYINGKQGVKPKNKQKIEEAIIALGYQVNEVARHLKMRSSQTIGVIIPSFSNVFAVKTVSHLETIFRRKNYALQVFSYDNSFDTLDAIINSFIGRRVEGLIIMPSNAMTDIEIEKINALIERKTPVVLFDSKDEGVKCDHIGLNNYEELKKVTGKILDMGHKDIALFLGPAGISSSKERLQGYIDAHVAKGVKVADDLIAHTDYSKNASRAACVELLNKCPQISAVLTAGYRITLGVLSAINSKNLTIPDNISLVGFDIMDIADILPYPLTGIYIPTEKVAESIAEIMLKRIESGFTDESYRGLEELGFIEGNSIRRNEDINELFK